VSSSYPEVRTERDTWILGRRPQRNALDPLRPYEFFVEDEYSAAGEVVPVATIFLTNRECPWRCLMCDLWKNTLTESVPLGAIPTQIDYALQQLSPARQIKLYNSGSFFDLQAIPLQDHPAIASQVAGFERVIVECHPALVGENCVRFKNRLSGRLEVAMGLETVHPQILARLNKGMTTEQFAAAASTLRKNDIDLRVFILVKPPFMREEEAFDWAARSLDFAFDCGATAATLIPTRGGNGAMEKLATIGEFAPPRLATLEAAVAYGLALKRGRVFVDLWDAKETTECPDCSHARISRLRAMNLQQTILKPVACKTCAVKHRATH
jgi:radical SAM enzyme (TIGR01210 family)